MARALHGLVEGGRHQEMFGFVLGQLRDLLGAKEDALRVAIEERVREQGGRLVGWALGASIARRVLATVNAELDKMKPGRVRTARRFRRMGTPGDRPDGGRPARAAEVGAAIRRVVAHETVQAWLWDVWARLRLALEADAARPKGRTVTYLEGALANAGAMLEADPAARERVHIAVEAVVASLLPAAQMQLSEFIVRWSRTGTPTPSSTGWNSASAKTFNT